MEIKYGDKIARVNDLYQLTVDLRSEWVRVSEDNGEAFIFTCETYDYTGADTILLVKNSHASKNMYVKRIKLHGDTETEVEIHVPTASFTIDGTAVVGECLNQKLDKDATLYATAKADETGNTQGNVIERVRIKADTDYDVDLEGALIIKPGDSVGVDYATDGGEAHVSIWAYWK
jgi:hypothetical protein